MYLGRSPTIGTQRLLDSIESQFNGTLTTFDLRYGGVPTYPTLSAGLLVSIGGVLQEPSEAYYVSSDKIVLSEAPVAGTECWILLYSEFGAAQSGAGEAAIAATGEPMGFENRPHSTISFASNTRTFSIAPNTAAGHSSYAVWTKGTRRTYSVAQSVQIGTTTGLYYIYFDGGGALQSKTTYFTWDTETPVAYVYWNGSTTSAPFVADERHGIVLDWQTHEYLHRTRGAVIAEGFSISAYTTTGDGSADAHAQFDLGNGTFFDEDLEVAISHSASPTVGTFTQVLTGAAEIPVFFLSGSSGAWVRDTPTEYACKQSATTLQYNLLTGSTWSTTPATNNRYVVSWVVATNDINAPIIAILGQDQYTAIGSAEATRFGDLVLTNFPIVEFRPLWKVIFKTSTSFTNTPNARVANILDLRQLSETGEGGTVVSDHGLLSGLADDDHTQYLHTTLDRTGVSANISTTGAIGAASLSTGASGVGVNIDNAGLISGPATITLDPAAVGDDTGLVRIKGGLEVLGTTTTISSTTLTVVDKNIVIAQGGSTLSSIDTAGIDFGSTAVRLRYNYNSGTNSGLSIEGGNVGIGVTSPGAQLDIYNSQASGISEVARLRWNNAGAGGALTFANQAGTVLGQISNVVGALGAELAFSTYSNSTAIGERMRLDANGRLGIGTSLPGGTLDVGAVAGAVTAGDLIVATGSTTASVTVGRISSTAGDSTTFKVRNRINSTVFVVDGPTERVGIGTTPVVDLDVAPAASTATFRIHARSNTAPVVAIELVRGTSTTFGADAYGDYRIKNDTGNLSFEYGDSGVTAERARIDSSGNLGLGMAPSAWGVNYKALQIAPCTALLGNNNNGSMSLLNNAYVAGAGGGTFTYISTAAALNYTQNNGIHSWLNAPSGTAGNAITFTQAMMLDASGNLGIGSAITPTTKLDVAGSGDSELRLRAFSDPSLIFSETTANKNWKIKPSAGDFYFQYSATAYNSGYSNLLIIKNTGRVGIGTTSPLKELQINATTPTIRLEENSGGSKRLEISIDSSALARIDATQSGSQLLFGTVGTERMRIDASGNVGIGITNPSAKLHVAGPGNTPGGNIHMGDKTEGVAKWTYLTGAHYNAATNGNGISLIGCYSNLVANRIIIGGDIYECNPATSIEFYTHTATTHNLGGSSRMTINSTGNVGIGTANPGSKLTVNGDVSLLNGGFSQYYTASGNVRGYITASESVVPGSAGFIIATSGGEDIAFKDGGVGGEVNMVIKGSGNVGIGITNPNNRLVVQGGTTITGDVLMTGGVQGSPGFVYLNSGGADATDTYLQAGSTADVWSAVRVTGNWTGSVTGGGAVRLYTAGQERLTVNSAGVTTCAKGVQAPMGWVYQNTYTINSTWSSGWQTIIPSGICSFGTYVVSLYWDYAAAPGAGSPYYITAATIFTAVPGANGTGTENAVALLSATHTGGTGAYLQVRTIAFMGGNTGLQVNIVNYTAVSGTIFSVYIQKIGY